MRMISNGLDHDTNIKINEIERTVKESDTNIKKILTGTDVVSKAVTESLQPIDRKVDEIKTELLKIDSIKTEVLKIESIRLALENNKFLIESLAKLPEEVIIPKIEEVIKNLSDFLKSSDLKYALKADVDNKQEKQLIANGIIDDENNILELKHNESKIFGVDLLINYQCFGGINVQKILEKNAANPKENQKVQIHSNVCGIFQLYSKDKDTIVIEYTSMPSFPKIKAQISGLNNGVLDLYIQPEE